MRSKNRLGLGLEPGLGPGEIVCLPSGSNRNHDRVAFWCQVWSNINHEYVINTETNQK